jgi:hypothetical protein
MSEHPSYGGRLSRTTRTASELPDTAEPAVVGTTTPRYGDRACCCAAQPAAVAVMPPATGRPAETELLLCGHHYRASKAALTAASARFLDLAGHPLEGNDWPGESG